MYDEDNVYHPKFSVKLLDKTEKSINEERYRILLPETGKHYYLAISSTVLAVWSVDEPEKDKVARQLADRINVLIGNPPQVAGNYLFDESNTKEEDSPKILALPVILDTLKRGSDPTRYRDPRPKIYD